MLDSLGRFTAFFLRLTLAAIIWLVTEVKCKGRAERRFVNKNTYKWYAAGDVNAFFGLMLDNIAGLVLAVGILVGQFQFPVDFALRYMVPGTALGVLAGDLMFFVLAFRLAKKEKRSDVTAMPLGLDTPSTIGMVLFVVGPAFALAKAGGMSEHDAATHAWHIGICGIFLTGIIKMLMALGSGWIRKVFPRAGLLGSLAAIALVLIAFTQLEKLASNPIVGFASLVIVFVTLIARNKLPFQIPGAFAAVLVGCAVWYLLQGADHALGSSFVVQGEASTIAWLPTEWLTVFKFEWLSAFGDSLAYLPYILPFAIATVIGGIDCAESAASAGDDFHTGTVIGIEGVATLFAALCGGVIQTTPYIGHPAYKAMGGRAAYTLATALFIGGAGLIGYFSVLFRFIPEAAILPILIFIGIEITAQSFHATPRRHYAAIAIACLPALAKLVTIYLGQYIGWLAENFPKALADMPPHMSGMMLRLSVLAGGFILTSLIWASATARIIDRKFFSASVYFAVGGIFVLFGVMHSPKAGDQMFMTTDIWRQPTVTIVEPGETDLKKDDKLTQSEFDALPKHETAKVETTVYFTEEQRSTTINFALSYLVMALLMFGLGYFLRGKATVINSDEEFEKLL